MRFGSSGTRKCAAVAALLGSSIVAGCSGSAATPQIIYTYLPTVSAPPTAAPATPALTVPTTPEPALTTAPPTTSPTAAPTHTPTHAPTATPVVTPPLVAPTVSATTITSSAPDGRWTTQFRKPVVSGVAKAAVMNTAITTRVNKFIADFNGAEMPVVAPGDEASYLRGDYTVAFVSATTLSLRFRVETYITGGAHPIIWAGSLNFAVATGATIALSGIFTTAAAGLAAITPQAHTLLTAAEGADLFWPTTPTMDFFDDAWVMTTAGLELSWTQGDVAPMSSGVVTITIPWAPIHAAIAPAGPAGSFIS